MVRVTYRTTEELCIVAWTGFLTWLPKLDPSASKLMSNDTVMWMLFVLDVLIVSLSWVLSLSGLGKYQSQFPCPPNTPVVVHLFDYFSHMTMMDFLRLLLSVTLPILGVMLTMHPATMAILNVVKKFIVLEDKMWRQWCPESYIIFFSICLILFVARRSVFTTKVKRHDRLKLQPHEQFYYPSPAYNYGLA
ncbi:uncharacterized protein [Littorina saxatilis]|uniref:Uncharacterized protein n=1 Tax=Littorina saxatilis TaxID=31220 RepID=A0AAN9AWV8_9CAEN